MSRQTGALPSILFHYTLRILRSDKLLFFRDQFSLLFFFIYEIPCLYLQSAEQDVLDLSTLIAYLSYARRHIHPELSDEAAEELTRGYVEMRRRGNFPGSSKKVRSSDLVLLGFSSCLLVLLNFKLNLLIFCNYFLHTQTSEIAHDSIYSRT